MDVFGASFNAVLILDLALLRVSTFSSDIPRAFIVLLSSIYFINFYRSFSLQVSLRLKAFCIAYWPLLVTRKNLGRVSQLCLISVMHMQCDTQKHHLG